MISHLITACKRSCDKVMFSEVFVCPQGVSISGSMSIREGGGIFVSGPMFLPRGLPDRKPPWTETPWTESPLDRDPPGRRPLDTEPPGQRPPEQRSPGQRPPWTETSLDRDPLNRDPLDKDSLDRDPPCTVKSGQCAS